MNDPKVTLTAISIIILVTVSGCVTTAIKATNCAYNHVRGDLLAILAYNIETVQSASEKVLEELDGYDLGEKTSDYLSAQLIAYDERARTVQIDLTRTENNQTRIQIRIGAVGDKLESSMIFNRIVTKLSEAQPPWT